MFARSEQYEEARNEWANNTYVYERNEWRSWRSNAKFIVEQIVLWKLHSYNKDFKIYYRFTDDIQLLWNITDWSSYKGRRANALALGADEGRDKLR